MYKNLIIDIDIDIDVSTIFIQIVVFLGFITRPLGDAITSKPDALASGFFVSGLKKVFSW